MRARFPLHKWTDLPGPSGAKDAIVNRTKVEAQLYDETGVTLLKVQVDRPRLPWMDEPIPDAFGFGRPRLASRATHVGRGE
jgi:hypothetical protein